jgi:RNA polymerase sigma-70 factor (ECF subfamily)
MNDALLNMFNRRDKKAWDEIFDVFSKTLFSFVNRIINNEDQALEIVNDCFIKICENGYQFEAIQQLKAFLFKTARNTAINFLKKDARENKNSLSYALLQDTSANIGVVEDRELEYRNLLDKIRHEIQQHPPERRAVFELFYFQGKSAIEIAAIKEINVSNVYDYKNTLVKSLRDKFGLEIDKLL